MNTLNNKEEVKDFQKSSEIVFKPILIILSDIIFVSDLWLI